MNTPVTVRIACPLCGEICVYGDGPAVAERVLPCRACSLSADFEEKMAGLSVETLARIALSVAEIQAVESLPDSVRQEMRRRAKTDEVFERAIVINPESN